MAKTLLKSYVVFVAFVLLWMFSFVFIDEPSMNHYYLLAGTGVFSFLMATGFAAVLSLYTDPVKEAKR